MIYCIIGHWSWHDKRRINRQFGNHSPFRVQGKVFSHPRIYMVNNSYVSTRFDTGLSNKRLLNCGVMGMHSCMMWNYL